MSSLVFEFVDGTQEVVWPGSPRHRELLADGHAPVGSVPESDGVSDDLAAYLDERIGAGVAAEVEDPESATSAALSATYATRARATRDLFQRVPTVPLHPDPPTVALGAAGAATAIASGVNILASNTALRYSNCNGTVTGGAGGWYTYGATPNGSALDQGFYYSVDFYIDSADFEFRLAGQSASRGYRLWVDNQPLTEDVQAGPGATGTDHPLRITFATRKPRHIRILTTSGLTTTKALTIGPNDTVWASTLPLYNRRVYFLGDSFTAGSGATLQLGYAYFLSDLFGWEVMNGGESGTGYTNNGGGGGGRADFEARALTDIHPTNPDAVIIYGGTNDTSATGLEAAAAATYAALASLLPDVPVYVFGVQYPSGAADATRDAKDAAIQAAAAAAPNVGLFQSVKSWITGTGKVGTPAGTGNADLYTSSDGLHPSTAGHKYLASRMGHSLVPVYAPDPDA